MPQRLSCSKCGDNVDPGNIMRLALRGAFVVGPGFTWRPDLVTRADFTTTPPLTITYHIRPEARWSDGVPVTAHDFVFTHEARRSVAEQLINFEKDAPERHPERASRRREDGRGRAP